MISIKKEGENLYKFDFRTSTGHLLLESVPFSTKETLEMTLARLYPLLSDPNTIERKTDHNGKFLFHLKDGEGRVVGKSLSYSSEAGMENGIKNLKKSISHPSSGPTS
ncbi:MAG: DUF1508 domain-containing protein [Sediminicola sp.]